MANSTITFSHNDALEAYLSDCLMDEPSFPDYSIEGGEPVQFDHPVLIRSEKNDSKTILKVDASETSIRRVVSAAVCLDKKFSTFFPIVNDRFPGLLNAAFLGALVGHNFTTESQSLESRIPDYAFVNADGVYNFLLAEESENWKTLKEFARKLYDACLNEDDLKALIKYFMGGSPLLPRTIVLDNGIYFDDDNKDVPVYRGMATEVEDLTFHMLFLRPSGVIIPVPQKYPSELIELIRFLGE